MARCMKPLYGGIVMDGVPVLLWLSFGISGD